MKEMVTKTKDKVVRFVPPKTINLLGEQWNVEVRQSLKDSQGKHINGLCIPAKKLLLISALSDNPLRTFCHEASHAMGRIMLGQEVNQSESFALMTGLFWTQVLDETLKASQNPDKPKSKKQILDEMIEVRDAANKQIKKLRREVKNGK